MNYKALVALMVFAISRDMLDVPVERVISLFKEFASQMGIDRTVDIIIWDAQQDIKLGHSYGKYNESIMKF